MFENQVYTSSIVTASRTAVLEYLQEVAKSAQAHLADYPLRRSLLQTYPHSSNLLISPRTSQPVHTAGPGSGYVEVAFMVYALKTMPGVFAVYAPGKATKLLEGGDLVPLPVTVTWKQLG